MLAPFGLGGPQAPVNLGVNGHGVAMDLNQVALPCAALETSVNFYRRLGFRQIVANPPSYARFECVSGATFSLHLVSEKPAPSGVVIYFETEDLDATVKKLKETGIAFASKSRRSASIALLHSGFAAAALEP